MIVYSATSNPGKLLEFAMASGDGIEVQPVSGLESMPPPIENGATFEENAIAKALYYGTRAPGWLFAEDSGLEVDALGGQPGVLSARYAGPEATDEANNALLVERMDGQPVRSARFVCAIALVRAGELVRTFRGTVEGEILPRPRGSSGFGYDPLFYYPPFGCSFGEVDRERKQSVSHRGAALRSMMQYLRSVSQP